MRILYLGNNLVGWQVLRWLKEQGEEVVGLVVHPEDRQKYGDEIIKTADLPPERVFDGSRLSQPDTMESISRISPDIGLSIFFGYILKSEFMSLFPGGVVNLHPSFLPYNRGQYPNVWSIIEGTPAGVTMHYLDEGIDTGEIIAQQEVAVEPVDTGETLYRKLEQASVHLFQSTWPLVRVGNIKPITQDLSAGTFHRTREVEDIDEIDLDREYSARDLINILRARTFPNYKGAYFKFKDKRVYMSLQLEYGIKPQV